MAGRKTAELALDRCGSRRRRVSADEDAMDFYPRGSRVISAAEGEGTAPPTSAQIFASQIFTEQTDRADGREVDRSTARAISANRPFNYPPGLVAWRVGSGVADADRADGREADRSNARAISANRPFNYPPGPVWGRAPASLRGTRLVSFLLPRDERTGLLDYHDRQERRAAGGP